MVFSLALGLAAGRFCLGLATAAHGSQKLFGWFGGYGLAGTSGFFEQLGFRPGKIFATAAGLAELVGGLLIVFGLFGAVGPMLVVSTMLVAMLAVHAKNGFFGSGNGIEMPFLYAVAASAVAFASAGALSLDALFRITVTSRPEVVWGLLLLGVIGALGTLMVRRASATQSQPAA